MKTKNSKKFTYIVVFQIAADERAARVFTGTFNQVVKQASLVCSRSSYFIREIKVA